MQHQLNKQGIDRYLTEQNRTKQLERYAFNYNKIMRWGNQQQQQHTYYAGSQITNPENKVWLQVLEKQDEKQSIKKSLEKELKNLNCLQPNQHLQTILETYVQVLDLNLRKRMLKSCLILKISINESTENPQNTIKLDKKYQINLRNKFAYSVLGDIYQGFQIQQPMKKILIQVLSKPYEQVTQEQFEQVIDEVKIVIKNSYLKYFQVKEVDYLNSLGWPKKYYMIIQPMQDVLKTYNLFQKIQLIIKESKAIKISDGKYRFSHSNIISSGGRAYLGQQTQNSNNKVAIKFISSKFQDFNENKTKRFNKELNVMKYLDPSFTVRLLDEGQALEINQYNQKKTELRYFVMELMDGSLEKLYFEVLKPGLNQNKKQGMKLVKSYFFWILWAYRACYQKNVAHTNLKPQNILIKKNQKVKGGYQIKIADFGISTYQTTNSIQESAGTQAYRSPQQRFNTLYTYKCDIYALGGIFIYLILGQDPFALQIIQIKKGQLNKKKLYQLLRNYDGQDNQICKYLQKCLAFEEKERYQYDEILKNDIFEIYQNQNQSQLILNELGRTLRKKGIFDKALKYSKQCLEIQKKIKEKGSIDMASTLSNIGKGYKGLGDYKNALKYYEQCLEIQKKIKGEGSIETASTLNNIGNVINLLGDYQQGLKFYKQCLEIQKEFKGEGSIDTASTLGNIATVYNDLGDYQNAIKFYNQSLKIQRKFKGEGSIDTASTLNNIGKAYKGLGDYKNALKYYGQCLEIQKKIKEEGSIDMALTLGNIGKAYKGLGDYKNALKYYGQCLEIQKKIKGEGSIETASTLNNIGNVINLLGDYQEGLKYYKQCLEIQKKFKGEGSIDTASTLGNIGTVYNDLKEYKYALKYYKQCLEIQKKFNGEGIDKGLGDYKNAEKIQQKYREMEQKVKEERNFETGFVGNTKVKTR